MMHGNQASLLQKIMQTPLQSQAETNNAV